MTTPREKFLILMLGALVLPIALAVFLAGASEGESTLTVVNHGKLPISGLTLVGDDGHRVQMRPMAPGDSARFVFKGLHERDYSAEVLRSDGSTETVFLSDVSDGVGIDDTLVVSDTSAVLGR